MDRDLTQRYARVRRTGVVVGVLSAIVGFVALAFWVLDLPVSRPIMDMRPNTAACFVLLGFAIALLAREEKPRDSTRWVAAVGASAALLVAGLTLLEQAVGRLGGLDGMLARPAGIDAFEGRVRMSPVTAIAVAFVSCATLLTALGKSARTGQVIAVVATLLPLLALLGHVYRIEELYEAGPAGRRVAMSIQTALGLILLALGPLLARPDVGLMARITSDSPAAVMVRRMLPAGVLLPVALGAIAYAAMHAGWIGARVESAVVTIGIVAGLVLVVATSSGALERLEAERNRVEEDLRRAVRARDDFLSIASHELRTPMTTALILIDGLLRSTKSGTMSRADLVSKLEAVRRQAKRLERVVDALLDVTRVARGQFDLAPEPMDLTAAIANVVERYADEARRAGSPIALHAPPSVAGRWDPMRIDQIVSNLVSNALKYGKGSPVSVDVLEEPDRVLVRVTDEGIGIAPEDLDRIFQRFERAVSDQNYPGLGLGLWIARQIVSAMGGAISVEAQPGRGATFTVELPRPS